MEFTAKKIKAFVPKETDKSKTDHYEWDDSMPGFGIRIRKGGAARWVVKYRIGNKQRKITLKAVSQVTLDDAKKEAQQIFAQVAKKIDPANERARATSAASETFGTAIEGYLAKLKRETSSAMYFYQNELYLREHFKAFHGMALTAIDRRTVSHELEKINKRGRTTANRARSALSAFFGWAIRHGYAGLENNPAHMTNKNKEKPRERDLSPQELRTIWNSSPDNRFGDIVKLLMLTMQRRTEIGGLLMKEFNRAERQLEIDGCRTKNGLPTTVPLSIMAFGILDKYYDRERKYVFGGPGGSGYGGWSKSKNELDIATRLNKPWVLHDFRRAGKTAMEDVLGVADNVSEAILNHAKVGLAKHYNGAKYIEQKRDALDKYAAHLMKIVS